MKHSFLACCLGLFVATAPSVASGQAVEGIVLNSASKLPLGGATVLLSSDAAPVVTAQTDSLGRFRIIAPSRRRLLLRVQKVGFVAAEPSSIEISDEKYPAVTVFLVPSMVSLSNVKVSEKPLVQTSNANPTKFDLFLERKARGVGTFLTRDDIVKKNPTTTKGLLQGIAGIKVRQNGTTWTIQSQRCTGGAIPGLPKDPSRFDDSAPLVFVDNFRVSGIQELDNLNPAEIEAIEVFQGATQVPAEARGKGCAAIFIWLRTVGTDAHR